MFTERSVKQVRLEIVVLEELVPQEHLLRKIDASIDFSFINRTCKPYYCENNGRPAIEAETTKRIAPAPTVVKHVVKKFSEFQVVRKWWENARFCPENAKNKAENGSFSALFGLSDKT